MHRARLLGAEEGDDCRQIARRDPFLRIGVWHRGAIRWRVDDAGQHAVDVDVLLAQFAGHGFGDADHREFDPLPALHRWKEDGELLDEPLRRRIGLPVVNKQHKTLTFHAWYPGCPMEEDAYGIPKPKDTEVIVPTLLFVPCVGYAAGGYRLGYGGGFYDRTLATLQPKPFTVGLGFTNGYLDDFEPEEFDLPLDAILNDNGVVWPV